MIPNGMCWDPGTIPTLRVCPGEEVHYDLPDSFEVGGCQMPRLFLCQREDDNHYLNDVGSLGSSPDEAGDYDSTAQNQPDVNALLGLETPNYSIIQVCSYRDPLISKCLDHNVRQLCEGSGSYVQTEWHSSEGVTPRSLA